MSIFTEKHSELLIHTSFKTQYGPISFLNLEQKVDSWFIFQACFMFQLRYWHTQFQRWADE